MAVTAQEKRPAPSRTRKLSPGTAMILHPTGCGKVAHRHHNTYNNIRYKMILAGNTTLPGSFFISAYFDDIVLSGDSISITLYLYLYCCRLRGIRRVKPYQLLYRCKSYPGPVLYHYSCLPLAILLRKCVRQWIFCAELSLKYNRCNSSVV